MDRLENAPMENFQDIDFEDLEQQQVRFEGKCPWCIFYLFSYIYLLVCMLVLLDIVGIPIFTSCLVLLSLGLTKGIG
jgi:hypothetical protein